MPYFEFNVSASAHLYTFVVGTTVQGPYARVTVSVSGSNGTPSTGLAEKHFQVWGLLPGRKLVDLTIDSVLELAKVQPSSPKGIYEISVRKQDLSGLEVTVPWTFIIQVKWSGWFNTGLGQTVVGTDLLADPAPY
jgi:hypothetical protein